ncbi:Dicer-like protein 2, partial [Haplosporangium sp. Z 27]
MTKDFMVVQSTKPLAMSVSACIACTLLLQQGKLDSNLMPFSDVASVPKLTTFGNNVLTSDKQEELGLGYMDGSILRVALSPYSKDMVSCSWAALGEAFLKFVFSAYNFARYQEDTEGILTARVGNELMIAVLSEYLELSQLTGYTCCPHVYNFQSISATTLRRVIGAAIVQIGADAGVRTIGALGMMTDASVNSIKDIDSIYKRYQAYVPMSLTLSDRQQASFSRSLKFKIEKVQGALGYKFRCPQLLIEAITHSSASPSALAAASYERLEFLGDAVLEFAVANHYHKRYPATNIKKFRMFKSLILANDALGSLCANLGLEEVITANQEINNCCKFDAARAVKLRASGVTKLDGLKLNKILGDVLEAL